MGSIEAATHLPGKQTRRKTAIDQLERTMSLAPDLTGVDTHWM